MAAPRVEQIDGRARPRIFQPHPIVMPMTEPDHCMNKKGLAKLRTAIRGRRRARRRSGPSLDLNDLLGRQPISLDTPELQRFLAGKHVLVTGAGGSIGSEICRQSMKFCPRRIVLLDQAENSLFEIDRELRQRGSAPTSCRRSRISATRRASGSFFAIIGRTSFSTAPRTSTCR